MQIFRSKKRRRTSGFRITSVFTLLILWTTSAPAQFSPGPLSTPHAHLEGITNCLSCHTFGSNDLAPNCLECHTPIQNRVDEKRGYHGLLEDKSCSKCHLEHAGKKYELIQWEPDKESFDHKQTGYPLTGKHQSVDCQECHQSKNVQAPDILEYARQHPDSEVLATTFLGLPTECVECHTDVHRGEFPDQTCDNCHSTADWAAVRTTFNHTTQTQYPLVGAHQTLDCELCHSQKQTPVEGLQVQRFGGLTFDTCLDCHEDYHHGQFDNNCLQCHTMDSFKSPKAGVVDHSKTRFPLVGKHQSVDCLACHQSGDNAKQLAFEKCSDCHADHHEGAFRNRAAGFQCDECHSELGFAPPRYTLMQHQETRFPLTGAHLALPCIMCHQDEAGKSLYFWEAVTCQSCHDNPHGNQFSRYEKEINWCESCHTTNAWGTLIFDHASTNFPLMGRHGRIACGECHTKQGAFVQYAGISTNCESCHSDIHDGQFKLLDGVNPCEKCHGFETWQIDDFDHDELTRFPLSGQHENVVCEKCHFLEQTGPGNKKRTVRFTPIAHDCQDCHKLGR